MDGFPRRKSQAEALDRILRASGTELEAVILLNLSEDVLLERITGNRDRDCKIYIYHNRNHTISFTLDRWIHPSSGRTYSYSFSPPKVKGFDDITGEALIRRRDDFLDSFKNRFHNYKMNLNSILEYYNDKGMKNRGGILHMFTGENSSEIYSKIIDKFTLSESVNVTVNKSD